MTILRHINKTVRYGNKILDYSVPSSPIPTANLYAHYKTDAGITKDGLNRISQWDDQSGNGNNLVQGTGANQPLHNSSNQQNGYDAITMAGTNTFAEYFTCSSSINFATTIFVVGTLAFDTAGHDNYDLISSNNGNYGTKWLLFQSINSSNARSQTRDRSQVSSEYNLLGNSYSVPVGSTFMIKHVINPPSSGEIEVNQVNEKHSEGGTNYITSASNWQMGKWPTSNIGYDGDVYEVIIYNGTLSAGDTTTVENYLKTKYAI